MKGLLTKDFLTIKKKYGIARLIMDLAIIAALMIILEGAGSIYISFLLVPLINLALNKSSSSAKSSSWIFFLYSKSSFSWF